MGLAALLTELDTTAGAIMFVALLPMIIASYLYIRFLADSENKAHRKRLTYAVWLAFFTTVMSAVIGYAASHSTGNLNTKLVKAAGAADPKMMAHPKNVQANVIPRQNKGVGETLINIAMNLLWSYYIWKKVEIFTEQAKDE
jgi:cytochrome bd-type quinol oxidase subunit 1